MRAADSIASGSRPSAAQDRPLVPRPTQRVLADAAVSPDHAVARHDERHRVVPQGGADGADRLRTADLRGDPAVRPDLAPRDLERLVPDVALEVGVAAQVQVDPDAAVAVQPARDGPAETARAGARPGGSGDRSAPRGWPRTWHRPRRPRRPTRPDRSRPRPAGRSASRTGRTGRPARPRPGRSGPGSRVPGSAGRSWQSRCRHRWSCGHLLAFAPLGRPRTPCATGPGRDGPGL